MASFTSSGSADVLRQLQQADLFDDETAGRLLDAGGSAFVENVRREMSRAPYRLSAILQKVTRKGKQIKRDKEGRPYVAITINGKNKRGERNAAVAFVLNYGRRPEYGEIAPAHFWERAKMKTAEALPQVYADVAEQIYQERGLS